MTLITGHYFLLSLLVASDRSTISPRESADCSPDSQEVLEPLKVALGVGYFMMPVGAPSSFLCSVCAVLRGQVAWPLRERLEGSIRGSSEGAPKGQ